MVDGPAGGSGESRLENWISYILIVGVILSLLLEAAGIYLFFRTSHTTTVSQDRSMFIQGQNFFAFAAFLVHDVLSGLTAVRLMVLGIAILILTPYIRALISVFYFVRRANIKYAIITAFVLAILTLSLMAH